MATIVTILSEGYADWETALLNAVARSYYGVETRYATPGGSAVTSAGGLRVAPQFAIEALDPKQFDALVVNGGTAWAGPEAPQIGALLAATARAGKVLAAICDGTRSLAAAGLLDDVAHTSNASETLAVAGYNGASCYQNQPAAVRDGLIVTAAGTAPVSFMAEVLGALGLRDANLEFYLRLLAAEQRSPPVAA